MRTVTVGNGTGAAPYRVLLSGAELRMMVLAPDGQRSNASGVVGVDIDSGAFVRASYPASGDVPAPFDVVVGEVAGAIEPPDAARPEAVELTAAPSVVGHMPLKRAERLLAPLHHPPRLPLLGFAADAVPYWTLTGDSPSLALIELRSDPRVRLGEYGPECQFTWQGAHHQLTLTDLKVVDAMEQYRMSRVTRGEVVRLLGFRPRRLLVMLTAPIEGYCHKAIAALLPTVRG